MLNHIRELELNTTDILGNEKAKEMMNARPLLDINSAEAASYFNNYEILFEDMDLEKKHYGICSFSRCGLHRSRRRSCCRNCEKVYSMPPMEMQKGMLIKTKS